MEHRWSRRYPVCLDAFVFHRRSGLIQVNILNISLDGAFVVAEQLALPPQVSVDLTFTLETAGKQAIQQMEALVIHGDSKGYGLMFKSLRRSTIQTLAGMLFAA
jgi:hypothetical protein